MYLPYCLTNSCIHFLPPTTFQAALISQMAGYSVLKERTRRNISENQWQVEQRHKSTREVLIPAHFVFHVSSDFSSHSSSHLKDSHSFSSFTYYVRPCGRYTKMKTNYNTKSTELYLKTTATSTRQRTCGQHTRQTTSQHKQTNHIKTLKLNVLNTKELIKHLSKHKKKKCHHKIFLKWPKATIPI